MKHFCYVKSRDRQIRCLSLLFFDKVDEEKNAAVKEDTCIRKKNDKEPEGIQREKMGFEEKNRKYRAVFHGRVCDVHLSKENLFDIIKSLEYENF